ncbi:MAG: hydroxymethylbilane synthase [Candidatus Micrarchaeota archaeon]|nr:hydroxymethylbilane synthase [Candidatus Micrarchaeota archaeon]MDE1804229.1 hydroxymethylbilane synthase [Candidatus Micrarchaeota archaeon]MDE1846685.1 hydroxymethylbilane synthase [Candidatus Micrarchaeota archaeon]
MEREVVVGTRGSKLSVIQTEQAVEKIRRHFPEVKFRIQTIKTEGDKKPDTPLGDFAGDGIFTKEIEKALLSERIDIAVHSLKDLPTKIHPKLTIGAILEREDARDVLISHGNLKLDELPKGATVGTESPRRIAQLLAYRKDIRIAPLRGNVDTRIGKLDNGEYDAIVIAAAGVIRLGLAERITQYLPVELLIPAPGQGALAIETRAGESELNLMLSEADHHKTRIEVTEERSFLSSLGGGCVVPIAAYASSNRNAANISGMVGDELGRRIIRDEISTSTDEFSGSGKRLAGRLLVCGAYKILEGEMLYTPLLKRKVLLTSQENLAEKLSHEFRELGAEPIMMPSLKVTPVSDFSGLDQAISLIGQYDWAVFTSANGVRFVLDRMIGRGTGLSALKRLKVAAVGPATAKSLSEYGITVSYVPRNYLTAEIAKGIGDVEGKKMILLRSNISDSELPRALEEKGAKVTQVDAYMTLPSDLGTNHAAEALRSRTLSYVVFTSASSVLGTMNIMKGDKGALGGAKVVCIGPKTAKAAEDNGVHVDIVAEEHTAEGIIKAILIDDIGGF